MTIHESISLLNALYVIAINNDDKEVTVPSDIIKEYLQLLRKIAKESAD